MENKGISFKEFSVTCQLLHNNLHDLRVCNDFTRSPHLHPHYAYSQMYLHHRYTVAAMSLILDSWRYSTRPLAVLCCRRSPGYTMKAQLTTYFISIIDTPVIITNCTPLPAVINLNTAIKSFARKLRRCLKNSHIERKVRDKTTKLCFYTNNKVE